MIITIIIAIASGWLTTYISLSVRSLVDDLGSSEITPIILDFSVTLVVVILARETIIVVRKVISERIATDIERNEYRHISSHMMSLDQMGEEAQKFGRVSFDIDKSVEGLVKLFKVIFLQSIPTFSLAVMAILAIFVVDPRIGSLTLVIFSLMLGITFFQAQNQKGIRLEIINKKGDISGSVAQLMLGIGYVRAIGAIGDEEQIIERETEALRRVEMKHHYRMMTFEYVKQFGEGFGFILVIASSAYLFHAGEISLGSLTAILPLYLGVSGPVRELHKILDESYEAAGKIEKLNEIYELKKIMLTEPNNKPVSSLVSLNIKGLKSKKGQKLLGPIKFEFGRKRVGIVGESGAGKSLLLNLIAGNVRSFEGECLLNGRDVLSMNSSELGDLINFVPQDPFVIDGTVLGNLQYGNRSVNRTRAAEIIAKVGLQTLGAGDSKKALGRKVDERGATISGGQKQRLTLARELLRENDIWLLDEPTSALDPENEHLFIDVLEEMTRGKTLVMVAHRWHTLRFCDEVVVMDQGVIAETGSYNWFVSQSKFMIQKVRPTE